MAEVTHLEARFVNAPEYDQIFWKITWQIKGRANLGYQLVITQDLVRFVIFDITINPDHSWNAPTIVDRPGDYTDMLFNESVVSHQWFMNLIHEFHGRKNIKVPYSAWDALSPFKPKEL